MRGLEANYYYLDILRLFHRAPSTFVILPAPPYPLHKTLKIPMPPQKGRSAGLVWHGRICPAANADEIPHKPPGSA